MLFFVIVYFALFVIFVLNYCLFSLKIIISSVKVSPPLSALSAFLVNYSTNLIGSQNFLKFCLSSSKHLTFFNNYTKSSSSLSLLYSISIVPPQKAIKKLKKSQNIKIKI